MKVSNKTFSSQEIIDKVKNYPGACNDEGERFLRELGAYDTEVGELSFVVTIKHPNFNDPPLGFWQKQVKNDIQKGCGTTGYVVDVSMPGYRRVKE